jgi:aspartyl-tRNA(Asn)/glutamyl-tRNA(Gln) amidotransferase subunit C
VRGDERARTWRRVEVGGRGDLCVDGGSELLPVSRIPAARDGRWSHVAHGITALAMIASPIMASGLTVDDVERIAALAQLELTAEEKQLFTRQLADILAYAEQVQAIDTSGVAATAHVHTDDRTEREDEPQPSLARGEALANAPDAAPQAGFFRVPRVIG